MNKLPLLGALAASLILSGCSKEEPVQEGLTAEIRPVKLLRIDSNEKADWRSFPAQVQASDQTDMAFRVAGEVFGLPVKSGQIVEKGQLLAVLDPTDYQVQTDANKARFNLAKSQFKRVESMLEKGVASDAQFDQAKAEMDIARAAFNAAENNLAYTRIYAPFNGVVSNVFTEKHQTVGPMQPVMRLQSEAQLEVTVQLPENIIAQVRQDEQAVGYRPQVVFSALPEKVFYASYKEHSSEADPRTGSYSLVLSLSRPQGLNILPGMTANVKVDLNKILLQQKASYLVPSSAVFSDDKDALSSDYKNIWVINESEMRAVKRQVKVGQLKNTGIEITEGLLGGELIITAGVHQISNGQPVRAWVNERGL